MNTIYTDGATRQLTDEQAKQLLAQDLIRQHPGAGADGIDEDDYILTHDVDWSDINACLDPQHEEDT